jgi:hypothetical protein
MAFAKTGATASPPPLAGEGQGGGKHKSLRKQHSPSPSLPRKRGREQAVLAAIAVPSIPSRGA